MKGILWWKKLEMKAIRDSYLPTENVVLCLSFFALGLKMFIPLVRLALQKCLINAASTLSINLETWFNANNVINKTGHNIQIHV